MNENDGAEVEELVFMMNSEIMKGSSSFEYIVGCFSEDEGFQALFK